MPVDGRRIVGRAHLHEPGRPYVRAEVGAGAVHRQIVEEEDVARFGRELDRTVDPAIVRVEVPVGLPNVFESTPSEGARHGLHTSLVDSSLVEMHDRGDGRVVSMRKEGPVLMHRERRSPLGWLHEELVVMELHSVGPEQRGKNRGESIVDQRPREDGGVEMQIVAVVEL